MHRMIGFGSALVDQLAFVPEAFVEAIHGDKGGMELVDTAEMAELTAALPSPPSRVPGGSAANTMVAAAHLGMQTRLLTKVGADADGAYYRDAVAQAGVETTAFKVHPSTPTGTCLSLVTPDSQRTMRTLLGAAATITRDDIEPSDFAGCTHLHVEGYMLFDRRLTLHVLHLAKTAGCTISLDLASPELVRAQRTILPAILREYVDMVFANEDEAAAFAGTEDEPEALRRLAAFADLAVVKLGARGALIQRDEERVAVDAKRVEAVDTTGAGDTWAAGFLYGLLTDGDLSRAGRIGATLAAAVVQQVGATVPADVWTQLKDGIED